MKTVGYIPKKGKPKDGGKTETAITDGNKADGAGGNGSKPNNGAE